MRLSRFTLHAVTTLISPWVALCIFAASANATTTTAAAATTCMYCFHIFALKIITFAILQMHGTLTVYLIQFVHEMLANRKKNEQIINIAFCAVPRVCCRNFPFFSSAAIMSIICTVHLRRWNFSTFTNFTAKFTFFPIVKNGCQAVFFSAANIFQPKCWNMKRKLNHFGKSPNEHEKSNAIRLQLLMGFVISINNRHLNQINGSSMFHVSLVPSFPSKSYAKSLLRLSHS